jgi:hypothetical protein
MSLRCLQTSLSYVYFYNVKYNGLRIRDNTAAGGEQLAEEHSLRGNRPQPSAQIVCCYNSSF